MIAGNFQPETNGYTLSGGQLSTPEIQVFGGVFHHLGGSLSLPAPLTLGPGTWDERTSGQQFGELVIGGNPGSNTIVLPSIPCQLRFAASTNYPWGSQAVLYIDGWNGSVAGGGQHQISFGSTSGGLKAQQLNQIRFRKPSGAPGLFPARILATGEIVPDRFLAVHKSSTNLVIEWASGTLQSATNVTGPYQDVGGATSPYNAPSTSPQRFFRIRN